MDIVRRNDNNDLRLLEGGNPANLEEGQLYEVCDFFNTGSGNLLKLDGINGFFPESYFTRIGESYDKPKTRTWIRKTEFVTSEDWILLMA